MKKQIIIISNYYPPETGAAANRIQNMAEGLLAEGNEITVLCPMPNYPNGEIFSAYKNKFKKTENIRGIHVMRYWLFPSKSKNSIVRFFSMISFSITIWSAFFKYLFRKPDLFIIQSPPLFIALSGLLMAKVIGVKNILNVSDIWPLSALELGVLKKGFFYSMLTRVEKRNYTLADKIMGQSEEIICHISKKVHKPFLVYRNVPKYISYAPKKKPLGRLKIVYAGLLGFAQDIFTICKEINFKELDVEFHIYGAGMDSENIKKFTKENSNNVFYHGNLSANLVKEEIRKYDIALIPLKNRIYGAVPSKLFEMMQLGLPVLFTEKGEAAEIIEKNNIGFVSSDPNTLETIRKGIFFFKNLDKKNFNKMSKNSLLLHESSYRLEESLNKLVDFINTSNDK